VFVLVYDSTPASQRCRLQSKKLKARSNNNGKNRQAATSWSCDINGLPCDGISTSKSSSNYSESDVVLPQIQTILSMQYVEIYQDRVTDLVTGNAARMRETLDANGNKHFIIQGAPEIPVTSLKEALHCLYEGHQNKKFAATAMNDRSSRAHTLLIINISQINQGEGSFGQICRSQLQMVDLAGCEQIKKSKVTGVQKSEAIGINRSLMVLGKCITALVKGQKHVPYYEAKLTCLLRGAFGGNSRTMVISTCSLSDENGAETFNALSFCERMVQITNSASLYSMSYDKAVVELEKVHPQPPLPKCLITFAYVTCCNTALLDIFDKFCCCFILTPRRWLNRS
jgi:hypothetical protein